MQAVVIDVFDSEAYVSLQDGTNMCIGLAHLPSNIRTGTTINISISTTQMINHKVVGEIL
jgi:hypothetical protein